MYAIRSYYVSAESAAILFYKDEMADWAADRVCQSIDSSGVPVCDGLNRITSYNVCYTKLLRSLNPSSFVIVNLIDYFPITKIA